MIMFHTLYIYLQATHYFMCQYLGNQLHNLIEREMYVFLLISEV